MPLTGTSVVVGRLSRSRGVVPDISWVGGGRSVVDVGSANGTYVAARWLSDGDRIYVGGWTCLTARAVTANVR